MTDQLDWFFDNDGDESGPYTTDEINRRIKDGVIIADTLVWRTGMADWQRAHDVAELADWFLRPPPLDERSALPTHSTPPSTPPQPGRFATPVNQTSSAQSAAKANAAYQGSAGPSQQFKPVSMHARTRAQERGRRRGGLTWLLWVGLLAIIGIICAALAGLLLNFDLQFSDHVAEQSSQDQPIDQPNDILEALLVSPYSDSMRVISNYQPMEFEVVVDQFSDTLGDDQSAEAAEALAVDVIEFFVTRYRRYAIHAPDNVLRAVVETRIANLEAVQKIYPDHCAAFVNDGAASLGDEREVVLAPLFIAETTALLSAYFEGQKSGEIRSAASDQDLEVVLDVWEAGGVSADMLESLEASESADPNLCAATLSMLRAVAIADGDAAERVRATLVSQFVSN